MRHMNGEGESDWGPEKLDDVLVGMIERAARKKFLYPLRVTQYKRGKVK